MEYEIIFSEDALNDIFDIYYFIAMNDSFDNADKIKNKLIGKAKDLMKFPLRGYSVKEIADTYPELKETISKPFRIMFEIDFKKVFILAILDSKRDIQEILSERFLR